MSAATTWLDDKFSTQGPALDNGDTGTLNNVATTEDARARKAVRFSGVAPTLTGFADGEPGRPLTIYAVGGPIVLKNQDAGSLAANRIVTGTGGDLTIAQGAAADLRYDEESERWRVSAGGGSGGGGNGNITGTQHLAALRAKVGTADHEVTVYRGNLGTANDVSGGVFWWRAASTAADDGGTNIRPTAIAPGDPGRWERIHDGTHINVRWFGATGDGVTDDYAAIQKAVDYCTAADPARELFFPPGVYCVGTMPTTNSAGNPFRMTGVSGTIGGTGTQIKAIASITACFYFTAEFICEGIWFNGNAQSKYAVQCQNASFTPFRDCTWTSALYDGLNIIEGDAPVLDTCKGRGNGTIFCSRSEVAARYDSYISGNISRTITSLFRSSTNDVITFTVEADRHTLSASSPTGTFDLTTMDMRPGDIWCGDGGLSTSPDATMQKYQICQVLNDHTILLSGQDRAPAAAYSTDTWSLHRGDGFRTSGSTANNSQTTVRGGNYFGNAGSGGSACGPGVDFVFGFRVDDAESQYNGACGWVVGQPTCGVGGSVLPSELAGITYATTNGSATVIASASVAGKLRAGNFFSFASAAGTVVTIQSVSLDGLTITLTAPYTGPTTPADTIDSFDPVGTRAAFVTAVGNYYENNPAGAWMLSQVIPFDIADMFGGTFASASTNGDIVYDQSIGTNEGSQWNPGGVKGVGGLTTRAAAEKIQIGSGFSSVPQASLQNRRAGYEYSYAITPSAGDTLDSERSYLWCYLTADTEMTSTPAIAAPNVSAPPTTNFSQLLYVQNSPASTGALTIRDNMFGSGVKLQTPKLTIPPGGTATFIYSNNDGNIWVEHARSAKCTSPTDSIDLSGATATLTALEEHITVTAVGNNLLLPATPYDGKWYSVKGNGAFAVVIDGNGKNIDGAATYTQPANRSCTLVRYNKTTDEWEVRS